MARAEPLAESLISEAPGAGACKLIRLNTLTNDAATTGCANVSGFPIMRLINESGGSITVTFYDALSKDGTALSTYGEDSGAVDTLTVADDGSAQCPTSLAGCTWLILVLSASTATNVTLKCER